MTVFGYLFSALTMYAIPQEEVLGISWKFLYVLIPVACAIGKLSTRSLVMAYFTTRKEGTEASKVRESVSK